MIPENYEDIPVTVREALEDSFELYWKEECLEDYLRAVHEDFDDVTLEELEQDTKDYINEFLLDKLQDDH